MFKWGLSNDQTATYKSLTRKTATPTRLVVTMKKDGVFGSIIVY